MNNILCEDIDELCRKDFYFSDFVNSSVLVTGSTGLIGSIIVKSLLTYSKKKDVEIRVYAAYRSEQKFKSVFKDYFCEELVPVSGDVSDLDLSVLNFDYVIHGASITDSKTFVEKPVETINTAIDGTRNILEQIRKHNIKGFVYLSSLEVYGTFGSGFEIRNVKESDCGYLDAMNVRSSYSESKRLVETLCKSYASEFNLPVKVVRLCQTFGAGVEYSDNRVFAQFARSVIEERDIVLKTRGETVRNYCYTTDAVSGILTVLSKGMQGEVYNIANMDTTTSILDMAILFCNSDNKAGISVVFDISDDPSKLGYNPVVKIQLDSSKIQQLGWRAEVNLRQMIERLIQSMKQER